MQNKNVTVVGIGRVGLPFGLWLAHVGYNVFGLDVNEQYLEGIRKKRAPFVEEGLEQFLRNEVGEHFFPTSEPSVIANSEYIVITLGTPVDPHLNPDFRQVDRAIDSLLPYVKAGQTFIFRSTLAPGTTERLARLLEKKTGHKLGKDVFIAFCPERIAQGKALKETYEIPQIIGGICDASNRKAAEFFHGVTKKYLLTDARSAEIAKLFCNMYRYINFAIANEFMMLADNFDRNIHEITRLVNHDYPRGGLATPGFAAGPCLYKDGFFLLEKLAFPELISTSWRINENVPNYLVNRMREKIDLREAKVALLGLAFKKNIDDNRNSLSYKLRRILLSEGATVVSHDPFLEPCDLKQRCRQADVVIFAVNHDYYKQLGLQTFERWLPGGSLVCDVWNLFGKGELLYFLPKQKFEGLTSADYSQPSSEATIPTVSSPPS